VRAEPEGIDTASVVGALQDGWGFEAHEADYAAVGGGSYHWLVADASGGRSFVSVDDLDAKAWLGNTRDDVFDGLRCAFDTAASLRESGLDFVVAPTRTLTGASLLLLDARYSLALFPFVEGEAGEFGNYESDEERCGVAALLAQLHGASAAGSSARTAGFDLPGRRQLEAALAELGAAWTGGPLAEPARAAIAASASELAELMALADRLAAEARTRDPSVVVTHGEPHAANVMRVGGRQRLVDWDTVALGPPERDLWMVVAEESGAREVYERASGRLLDTVALDFFRLTWDLKDIAEYLNVLRGSHRENEDTLRHYRALTQIGDVWDRWSRGASPASGS
jgi:spectinomycin phosphotransferase